jgi:lysophospholipase L1-like esterase
MNPAALYFASGDSLYPGALLLMTAAVASFFRLGQRQRFLNSLATWSGMAMIVMACPPVCWQTAALFLVAFSTWLVARNRASEFWILLRFSSTAALAGVLLFVSISELFHRSLPVIARSAADHLVVIGDSISSGIDPRTPAWPVILEQQSAIPVRNLSRAGAGVLEARAMAALVSPQDNLVLIEIGGNDLLSDMSASEFGQGLDSLLASLVAPRRALVMFELPLLPHRVGFGRAQRRLSAKYGVYLIPKAQLTRVLSGADATSDGLHLSTSGAQRMANLVEQVYLRH